MKKQKFKYFVLSVFVSMLLAGASVAICEEDSINLFKQQKMVSHLLVNAFLEKIDKEGIVIFDHVIKKSDLLPHHVAYVYDIVNDELRAELCFKLTKQIKIPELEGYNAERIVVKVNNDGSIAEITTHVSPVCNELEQELD